MQPNNRPWRQIGPWLGIALASAVLTMGIALPIPTPSRAADPPTQAVARGTGGAVAAADARAARIGLAVLADGGNAVDAAIATAAALGVVRPFASGIGGGEFMVLYQAATDQVITLDGREQAPASATVDMFRDPQQPDQNLPFFPQRITQGAAVGVPGAPLLWAEAVARYGSRSLADLLAPAIALADDGFAVDGTFVRQLTTHQDRLAAFTSTAALYLPGGQVPAVGDRLRNPGLARTYRLLAQQGPNAFYRGPIAQAIADTVQHPPVVADPPFAIGGGGLTLADLDRYYVAVRPAVATPYRGHRIYGMGLPSSGGITVAQVLNLLAADDLAALPRPQAWHRMIEASRLAYADRNAYLGDPAYVDVPVAGLLSPTYAALRRQRLPETASAVDSPAPPGNPLPYQRDVSPSLSAPPTVARGDSQEGLSTTHVTVADGEGNLVAYTLTIESTGGSGMVVPGYGFLLNNELTDFDAVAPHPNAPEPGKRPRSSMAPTIVLAPDGSRYGFGSPGGSTIITTVLGIAVNLIDFGLPLDQAIAAPRLCQRNSGPTLIDLGAEASDLGRGLAALGHDLRPVAELGAATGIAQGPDGQILAAAEPQRRRGGTALVVRPKG